MSTTSLNNNNDPKVSPENKDRGWIGWYLFFAFGLAVPFGLVVALFFGFHAATPESSFFLILAILGIVVYVVLAVLLYFACKRSGDSKYKSKPVSNNKTGRITLSSDDLIRDPKLDASIAGLAMFHGLFGGRKKSESNSARDDFLWQEKYRHYDH